LSGQRGESSKRPPTPLIQGWSPGYSYVWRKRSHRLATAKASRQSRPFCCASSNSGETPEAWAYIKTDRRIIPSSTRKEHGTSGVNQAAQVTYATRSAASRKNRFGTRRAVSPVVPSQMCLGGCMAKIIEFYIPQSFRKVSTWLPANERGKLLAFPGAVRKSA
jgi:hypothetical protein